MIDDYLPPFHNRDLSRYYTHTPSPHSEGTSHLSTITSFMEDRGGDGGRLMGLLKRNIVAMIVGVWKEVREEVEAMSEHDNTFLELLRMGVISSLIILLFLVAMVMMMMELVVMEMMVVEMKVVRGWFNDILPI